MLNMIILFDPNHVISWGVMKEFRYFPTQYRNEFWKFEADHIPFYQSLKYTYNINDNGDLIENISNAIDNEKEIH